MACKAALHSTAVCIKTGRSGRSATESFGRRAWVQFVLCIGFLFCLSAGPARADLIKGDATLTSPGNYGRLLFQFTEEVPAEVSVAGSILVVRFSKPVDVAVDQLSDALPAYVSSARRDPDGSAIRLALSQKLRINLMSAGERIFVDLLPEKWVGLPPSLPPEVVKELSERALAAERALRMQKQADEAKKKPPVRVRTAVQPTFVRFVFELPDNVGVSSSLNGDRFSLSFSSPLTFDLADAKITAPANVKSITQKMAGDTSSVELGLIGEVDVHAFREDRNYVVDVGFDAQKSASVLPAGVPIKTDAPVAKDEAAMKPEAAKAEMVKPEMTKPEAAKTDPAKDEPASKVEAAKTEPAKPDLPKLELSKPEANKPEPDKTEASKVDPPKAAAVAPAVREALPEVAKQPAQAVEPVQPQKADVAPAQAQNASATEAPAPAQKASPSTGAKLMVTARRSSEDFKIALPVGAVASALFRRSDAIWLVVADSRPLNIDAIRTEGGSLVTDVSAIPAQDGQAIRIRLARPQISSLTGDDQGLTLILSDKDQAASQPLAAQRNITDSSQANVSIAFAQPGSVLRFADPDVGDVLTVVTASLPARGFARRQDFVEFSLLGSTHGVVVQPNSDDVTVKTTPEKIVIGRPGGLTLSAANMSSERGAAPSGALFDIKEWNDNQQAPFTKRLDELTLAASQAGTDDKTAAHLALARFYLAKGFYPEAKAILDMTVADAKVTGPVPAAVALRAVAEALSNRPELAMKDLADPVIGGGYDFQLWQALALSRLGKWSEAREKFKNADLAITSLPLDLQRMILVEAMRASLEVRDYSGATARGNELQTIGVLPEQAALVTFLRGRLSEALGRDKDALANYQEVMASSDRPSAADATLAEIALRQKRNEIADEEALPDLEALSVMWRGDGREIKTLQMLSRIYTNKGQYADALAAARVATRIDPNSDVSRDLQDETSALFSQLFLTSKGDDLEPVKALGLFYQYRELTPIGRRGDEMIRRLADRLAAVDLLDQAGELLQYQVDHRVEGAARAQIAARLAMIYLMNRKPERAIAALRSTRIADLSGEVRQQRLLLESRAQSDIGRNDLALDIIANVPGREAIRLRSDIYWATRQWRESAEQIEVLYGDRWRSFQPLTDFEKSDILRATIGYALAGDELGLTRFREKYAPKMDSEADRSAFDTASKPASADTADLTSLAKMAASIDTLDGFLRDMKIRFPDAMAKAKLPEVKADADTTGSLPRIVGVKAAEASRGR